MRAEKWSRSRFNWSLVRRDEGGAGSTKDTGGGGTGIAITSDLSPGDLSVPLARGRTHTCNEQRKKGVNHRLWRINGWIKHKYLQFPTHSDQQVMQLQHAESRAPAAPRQGRGSQTASIACGLFNAANVPRHQRNNGAHALQIPAGPLPSQTTPGTFKSCANAEPFVWGAL